MLGKINGPSFGAIRVNFFQPSEEAAQKIEAVLRGKCKINALMDKDYAQKAITYAKGRFDDVEERVPAAIDHYNGRRATSNSYLLSEKLSRLKRYIDIKRYQKDGDVPPNQVLIQAKHDCPGGPEQFEQRIAAFLKAEATGLVKSVETGVEDFIKE